MAVQPSSSLPDSDLFYEALIRSYIDTLYFIERPWLATRIKTALENPDGRFLLVTADPGVGKTTLMAWLAYKHGNWPRYFIRRDQGAPLGDVNTTRRGASRWDIWPCVPSVHSPSRPDRKRWRESAIGIGSSSSVAMVIVLRNGRRCFLPVAKARSIHAACLIKGLYLRPLVAHNLIQEPLALSCTFSSL